MEYSMKLLFWLYRSRINSKGLAPISLRISVNNKRTEVSTGLSIEAKKWDSKRSIIKGATPEAIEMNKRLALLKGKALKIYNELIEKEIPVSTEQIKNRLLNTGKEAKTLLEAFCYHNALLKSKIGIENTKATYTKYESLKKKVTLFITESLNRKDVFLKELNHQFVVEFEVYLKTAHKLTHNPAIKYIQFLKKIIHLSVANGWLVQNPFQNFKCTLQVKDRGYLTAEEIKLIEDKKIDIQRLAIVKDLFVFACYTGLSYSDMKQLCCRHIENKEDGSRWIVLNRMKTGIRSAIPLLPKALEILDRYEPPFIPDKDKPILPVITNQKMNAYLKEIGDISKVGKKLTFHLARHSFATTITLTNGVPIESVSKMLGHTNLKTTQHYSKVVDSKVKNDMDVLRGKLLCRK